MTWNRRVGAGHDGQRSSHRIRGAAVFPEAAEAAADKGEESPEDERARLLAMYRRSVGVEDAGVTKR